MDNDTGPIENTGNTNFDAGTTVTETGRNDNGNTNRTGTKRGPGRPRTRLFGNGNTERAGTGTSTAQKGQTETSETNAVQEEITLDVSGVNVRAKRGRKPGKRLTATQLKTAAENVAEKTCDMVSFVATFAMKDFRAQIQKDERENIVPPLSRILSKFEWISTVETGSDVAGLVVAVAMYGLRLSALSQEIKKEQALEQETAHTPAQTDDNFALVNDAAPVTSYLDQFVSTTSGVE